MPKNPEFQPGPSLLQKAIAIKEQIDAIFDQESGDLHMMLFSPWGNEQLSANLALKAEKIEAEGEQLKKSSQELWDVYEQRYGTLNDMMIQGEITLELVLDSPDKAEIEEFVQTLSTELGITPELVHAEESTEHLLVIGMNLPSHNHVYKIVIR
ncbi:MAG TPA: hypothetical protein VF209_00615 [Patescibacteria group bacterium]